MQRVRWNVASLRKPSISPEHASPSVRSGQVAYYFKPAHVMAYVMVTIVGAVRPPPSHPSLNTARCVGY
jgi:hypothetical protein